jgi:hypothetical protein
MEPFLRTHTGESILHLTSEEALMKALEIKRELRLYQDNKKLLKESYSYILDQHKDVGSTIGFYDRLQKPKEDRKRRKPDDKKEEKLLSEAEDVLILPEEGPEGPSPAVKQKKRRNETTSVQDAKRARQLSQLRSLSNSIPTKTKQQEAPPPGRFMPGSQ